MRVHSTLGNGFQEVVYQRALAVEMTDSGIQFEREMNMPIYYKGRTIGERRVDFFVQNKVMVEIKAILLPDNAHYAQIRNYLEAYNMEIGLLINFGSASLQFKRLQNPKFHGLQEQIVTVQNPQNP